MSKIKILVLASDKTGVGKFRSLEPHIFLQNKYPEDFHVDIDFEPQIDNMNYWKQYDMVCFHRTIGRDYDIAPMIIERLNSMGIVTVMDLDDYWLPTVDHPAYHLVVQNKLHEKIMNNLRVSQYVTTTTEIFAQEIKKFNKNVFILPNAINPEEPQFKAETKPSDKIRFGWLGGSSHLKDIQLLDGTFNKLWPLRDKFEVCLCGFDVRGSVTEINKQTNEQKVRPIKPEETVWYQYEKVFTDNYKYVSPEYKDFLMKFKEEKYTGTDTPSYHRIWTRPVTSYAKNYANFDVSLAPIKNHMFNRVKSQLKVIEAGFYKKAIIASDIGPYTIDLKHCLNNGNFVDGNAFLVNEGRNHSDWSKYIKKLLDNPNMVEDMGNRLYETVKPIYDLNVVTETRAQIYKHIAK
jgi:glycosyltransferase involved in cell wall biosynthesis